MGTIEQWKNKKEMDISRSFIFTVGFIYVWDIFTFFMNNIQIELVFISPGEIIWIYFPMVGIVGIVGIIPILAYQI